MRSVRSYQNEVRKLKRIIENAEWYQPLSNSSPSCPFCAHQQHWGHARDCDYNKALGIKPEPLPQNGSVK